MRRKKKSGNKKPSLEKILLVTATLDLICKVVDLILAIIELIK